MIRTSELQSRTHCVNYEKPIERVQYVQIKFRQLVYLIIYKVVGENTNFALEYIIKQNLKLEVEIKSVI